MTKEQRNELFKQHGVTKEEVKEMFHRLQRQNYFANAIYYANYKFKELAEHDYEEIINKVKEEKEILAVERIVTDNENRENDFETYIYNKLINGETNFSENDIEKLVDNYSFKNIEGDSGRWTQYIQSICDIKGILVAVDWEKGLTEYQENYYGNTPYFVKPETKTIIITEYHESDHMHSVNEINQETESELEEELDNDFDLD